ncbi:MAG TPA: DUF1800 family protein [Blastocatellia bacterium]|nr:DUF1800 family protein [Blastocatellia bacterium]
MKQMILRLYSKRTLALIMILTLPGIGLSVGHTTANPQKASAPAGRITTAAASPLPGFSDVATNNPFYTEISNIAYRQITVGCGGGNYCPNDAVTRAQMATFIVRSLGEFDPPTPAQQRFTDVPPSNPFYAFIDRLAALGITVGCGGGNFCPDDFVTRGQMAAFIIRGVGIFDPPTPSSQRFTDVAPDNLFYAFIDQMALRGITAGCGATTYCPNDFVTRAQMAAFLVRGFGLLDPGQAPCSSDNAVRFLGQATWGPTNADITHLQTVGIRAYLDEQEAAAETSYPTLPLQPSTVPAGCDSICQRDNYSMYPLQNQFFLNALYGQDQLRQRVAWALHSILVVSGRDMMQPSWMAPYLQIFSTEAFGNYRNILAKVTLNPAMGDYLNMSTSTKFNPNENYGREVLQLFSIGLYKLNLDGTQQLDMQGNPIPTYDQTVVTNFAKIFTGWRLATQPQPGVPNYIDPMVLNQSNHDITAKTLLDGFPVPAGQAGTVDLNMALDNIFNHQNVGPFISRALIHNLVTSNPTPAYVARVATVFNNDGSGVRGNMKAVVEAILLDPEARSFSIYGHLREPVLLMNNILRLFDAKSADRTQNSDGVLNQQLTPMDQDVLKPLTVFSYFPADYQVPGTNLTGPEFGILSTSSSLKRANFMNTIVFSLIGANPPDRPKGTSIDLTGLQTLAGNPQALVDELNRTMMAGGMSAQMQSTIVTAVNAVSASNPLKRARTALYLVATSSQFQVE